MTYEAIINDKDEESKDKELLTINSHLFEDLHGYSLRLRMKAYIKLPQLQEHTIKVNALLIK